MKRTIITLALVAFFAVPSFAQYWSTTTTYDPFRNGDKSIGLSAGTGWWFGPAEALITDTYGILDGYTPTKVSRPPLNPNISLHYKRVLQGNTVDWGSSYYLSYSKWGGKIEGQKVDTTFSTNFSFAEVTISSLIYVMVPIGEQIHINAGAGLTIGLGMIPKAEAVTFSNGVTKERDGGLNFQDMLIGRITATVGVDYALSDSFTVSANVLACAYDLFGSVIAENKNMHGVGRGVYVNNKLPFQLTLGFTYAL